MANLKLVKDDFEVVSQGEFPSIETYEDGFIVAYENKASPLKIYTVISDSSYSPIPKTRRALND